ncbi:hypothetical protein EYF80_014811 [Liparis tanakae]|uniref:Uncharacterized protein n=1 Tax=Liparis tanakae TaxID=230148 RepID=A0A4Z2ICS9_9TELE|nr:hypothetical protein EYF80_014811 [Liparis tanakae]
MISGCHLIKPASVGLLCCYQQQAGCMGLSSSQDRFHGLMHRTAQLEEVECPGAVHGWWRVESGGGWVEVEGEGVAQEGRNPGHSRARSKKARYCGFSGFYTPALYPSLWETLESEYKVN